ncbi:3-hydroxyacyl-CoA dehydrogenase NAD-binding domain-containing protein [Luminiphilus sp.]|jgi:3-hydroxyacyl-CoA dehydrogenase/enoyl-CoA hydratase/3-hydroxybutyryl-CoA epimerase|nr:3-hydroxyacyl-CoA dehydrogenase [Halieaceae bacterium]MBT5135735.1 3-hydroxyacyl-CoA dehydrogenase [Halieaceae bacterium]MBT5556654.1 3-hydroxyacyl-CoA dehydrogenase [Halieaceae bacterium]MDC6458800.1 3-hydroxyacyl-CoA dehydrogenase NAD-binding domain-containing protein [Luminiphilus sp.]
MSFHYEKDSNNIVTVTMDMDGPVNSMSDAFLPLLEETLGKLEADADLAGVVLASGKSTFFAGGDLNMLCAVTEETVEAFFDGMCATKAAMRRLEKLHAPVCAAINGAALGGGLELALSCHHRIAWNNRSVQLGFPEVTLGLLPGGGGNVKAVYLMGLMAANEYIVEGKRVAPEKALASGLIDAVIEDKDELLSAAKQWLLANKDDEAARTQPWDTKGYKIPGGNIRNPQVAQMVTMGAPMIRKNTRGLLPAPEKIFDVAVQALTVDFETAMRIESRGLAELALTPQAKNMINTFFFQMNKVNGGASRPKDVPPQKTEKVGILGAGMMGQGIAYSSAMVGIEVVLKDISLDAAVKGKAYTQALLQKRVDKGRMTSEKMAQVLSLIHPTASDEDLDGCDLIIEAVFENMTLKHQMTRDLEPRLADGGVWGSNTSTLPITQLAQASQDAENFIGIHFFSPVDKMPLVEIIMGEQTGDMALAKAFDFTKQIKKTPIVVNDSLGFFTSRTFGTYLDEGVRLLVEGMKPLRIDNLGKAVGMPVGPLTVYDEVSLELSRKASQTWKEMGLSVGDDDRSITAGVVETMVGDYGRGGRYHGGGFYEYGADGSKEVWSGLAELYGATTSPLSDADAKDRLLFRQVIEALKCLETGVLRTVADGNIGSIMGIGAPAWTGGLLQFVNTYGLQNFIDRCASLSAAYGERFQAPAIVAEKLANGETFV